MKQCFCCLIVVTVVMQLSSSSSIAQTRPTTAPAAKASDADAKPPLSQEELDQLLASVALYPDDLLSQMLMASTYPIEIVQADRWVKANKSLKGDAMAVQLEKQSWDPSVKSLVQFPDVLAMMSEKLDMTVKLGDAFIEDQKRVMDAVQKLRAKAQAAGTLKSNEQQKVAVEAAPAGSTTTTTQVITIEPTNPQVIYVPTYEPQVVYGTWPYPAYPPYPYYPPPPPSYPGGGALWFGAGLAIGAAWGYAWGDCDWHGGDVDVDIDKNVNIENKNIDREKYKQEFNNKRQNTDARGGDRAGNRNKFQHDPGHRGGAAYRDKQTAQKFGGTAGGGSSPKAAQARDAYRGRADSGRQSITSGSGTGSRTGSGSGSGSGYFSQDRASAGSGSTNRGSSSSSSGTRSSAFDGSDRSAQSTRSDSNRGKSSRSSASRSSGSSRSSGASRSSGGSRSSGASRGGGGGGARGGGGGRGGGGRR